MRLFDLVLLVRPHRQGTGLAPSDLTDAEWTAIVPLFPKVRGVPRADDRRVLNGILWRLRTGRSWAAIPDRYGSSGTCHGRFLRWRDAGLWCRIVEAVAGAYGGEIELIDAAAVAVPSCYGKARGEPDPVAWVAIGKASRAA